MKKRWMSWMQLFWLCFELLSHPPNFPFSFGNFLLTASTWEISFEWFARKRCNHQGVYWTILPHCSGCYFTEVEERAGYNSPQSSHCDSLSFQANWQMHIDFSQRTFTTALGKKKRKKKEIFTTTLWLDFYCFPHLHMKIIELYNVQEVRPGWWHR